MNRLGIIFLLVGTALGHSVNLTWTAPVRWDSFKVTRTIHGTTTKATKAGLTTTRFFDTSVVAGTTYDYCVQTAILNSDGTTSYSGCASVTVTIPNP
jgi:fibronectin type 3 domain-containing protein